MIFSGRSPQRTTLSMDTGSIFQNPRNILRLLPHSVQTLQSTYSAVLPHNDHPGTMLIECWRPPQFRRMILSGDALQESISRDAGAATVHSPKWVLIASGVNTSPCNRKEISSALRDSLSE